MITIQNLLINARNKLGDSVEGKKHYTDDEILDSLNDALAIVSEELLCFTRTWNIESKECVNRYALPADFLRPIVLTFNKKIIHNVKSLETRLKSEDTTAGASYDNQTFYLYLNKNIKESDEIEIFYNNFETVTSVDESINLPNNAKEVLLSYMLHLLFQKPIKRDHQRQSEYYLALFERKKLALISRMRSNTQSQNISSNFTKV